MTWEELKEKAIEMGYKIIDKYPYGKREDCICNGCYGFYKDGTVEDDCYLDDAYCGSPFAKNRNPDQMYLIMLAFNNVSIKVGGK